jgi:flagellar basal body rod protein FlgG
VHTVPPEAERFVTGAPRRTTDKEETLMRRTYLKWTTTLVATAAVLVFAAPAAADHPGLYEVSGNPSCADLFQATVVSGPDTDLLFLGELFGFKYDNNPTGDVSSTLTDNNSWIVTNGPQDPSNSVSIFNLVLNDGEGVQFDWSATLGMDAVIVKGGSNSNAYVYIPESTGDAGLVAPGGAGVSHVEFCYDYELAAEKIANALYTRTYSWEITKSVTPAAHSGFIGDSFSSSYDVFVDQTVTDSNYMVAGEITVFNPTPFNVTIDVQDFVDGVSATVTCPTYDLAPNDGASGGADEVTCTYSAMLGGPVDGTNTATVTSLNPDVLGASASADYAFGDPTTIVGDPTVNVTDSVQGPLGSASGDQNFPYSDDFACPTDTSLYSGGSYSFPVPNTATIVETDQSDSKTVTVTCYVPLVSKDATAAFDREYTWTIDKSVAPASHSGFIGDSFNSDYTVAVDRTASDSNFVVSGTITVQNPNPDAAMTVSVADSVGGVAATLDCGGSLIVSAGSSATCGYSASLETKADGTNTATVTLNGVGFPAEAPYVFGDEPANETGFPDINVTDTQDDSTAPWMASGDDSWMYAGDFQCPVDTGVYENGVYIFTVPNTATITETDQSDDASVQVTCYAPVVSKDAETAYTREFTWTISKSVDPASHVGYLGDDFTSGYTVEVDQTVDEYDFAVSGTITVNNPNPVAAMTVSISDSVAGVTASLECGGSLNVPAGGSAGCDYSASLDTKTDGTNTATVSFGGANFNASADYAFGDPTNVEGLETINVTDSQPDAGDGWTTSEDATWTYDGSFACPTNTSLYTDGVYTFSVPNTATITETDQSSDANVEVTCYAPTVSKDAETSYTREFTWTITKDADPISHTGFPGDSFQSGYDVAVDQTVDEYDFAVSGTITVVNPGNQAISVSISDMVDGVTATLDCGGTLDVPANSIAGCGYTASLKTKTDGTNTATVTFAGTSFGASADYAFGEPTNVVGFETINVTDTQDDSTAPWQTSTDDSWSYMGDFACPTDEGVYTDGVYTESIPNVATITETDQSDNANVDLTCYIPASARVIKTTVPDPPSGEIGVLPFDFNLFDPDGNNVEMQSLSATGEVAFTTELRAEGTWKVSETLPSGWVNDELDCDVVIAYPAAANQVIECSFTNTEKGLIEVLKLTNGIVNPSKSWTFNLYVSAFGGDLVGSDSTLDNLTGQLDFNGAQLDPTEGYTLCEMGVPAGWATEWKIDTTGDGIANMIVIPYNPDFDPDPNVSQDLGNRCFDFGAGTDYPVPPGDTLVFEIDNTFPGGDPRTPGYWKNWNTCSTGNQVETAAKNGGPDEGWYILDDILNAPGVSWGEFSILTCEDGVSILDQRDLETGRKMASDAAYTLAMHLLAAQLNFAAGAETCTEALDAALAAENLLVSIGFDGTGKYLRPKDALYTDALELAATLDSYNNGLLCTP